MLDQGEGPPRGPPCRREGRSRSSCGAQRTGPPGRRRLALSSRNTSGGSGQSASPAWQVMAPPPPHAIFGCDIYIPARGDRRNARRLHQTLPGQPPRAASAYTPYNQVTIPCTGTSVLALELCGKGRAQEPRGAAGGRLPRPQTRTCRAGAAPTFSLRPSTTARRRRSSSAANYWSTYRTRLPPGTASQPVPASGAWARRRLRRQLPGANYSHRHGRAGADGRVSLPCRSTSAARSPGRKAPKGAR